MLFMVTAMTVMKKFAIYFLRRGICDDMYWKKSITVQTYTISAMLEIMTFVIFFFESTHKRKVLYMTKRLGLWLYLELEIRAYTANSFIVISKNVSHGNLSHTFYD